MVYYLGVMSGTSLDGVDVALTSFSESAEFQFIAAQTFAFPDQLHHQLKRLINDQQCKLLDLGEVDIALGQLIGTSINQLLKDQNLSATDIVAIGSHGQTLFHSPDSDLPFSMQLGNANVIAEITGITTVADFRQRDIAAGGQGAPLVPAFHQALFHKPNQNRVIINIGGISNITIIPSATEQAVTGFDTGPGNVLLDYWVNKHLGEAYDRAGQWAKSGQYSEQLLAILMNDAYFQQNIPKSTGRELFNPIWLEDKLTKDAQKLAPNDVQATLVELTARSIASDIETYANTSSHLFICGGGAHNGYLLSRLQTLLGDKEVSTTDDLGLQPDWVEACAFAWLAYQTINQKTGNLPTVTGAQHAVILGAVYS